MKTMLGHLLFGPFTLPDVPGRTVRFDREELDIGLVSGPMEDRVTSLLAQAKNSMTASEIAAALQSNASQVTRGLRKLITDDRVEVIDVSGCPREYRLIVYPEAIMALRSKRTMTLEQD